MMARDITHSVVQILLDDASDVLAGLHRASALPEPPDLAGTGDAGLAVLAGSLPVPAGVALDCSDIALNSPNTVGMIVMDELHATAQVICGCQDAIQLAAEFIGHFASWPEAARLYRASLVVDVCSMMDATFGRHSLVPDKDVKGFLREAETRSMPALAELKTFEARMDGKLMTSIREIRNNTGAHVDPTLDPMDADAKLDSLNVLEVLALTDDLSQVLKRTWAADVRDCPAFD